LRRHQALQISTRLTSPFPRCQQSRVAEEFRLAVQGVSGAFLTQMYDHSQCIENNGE
jgi:hypothetical protein